MSVLEQLNKNKIPKHIAIIMDGNGRWALSQQQERAKGHKEGVATVRTVIEGAAELGVLYLTLYTFSTENWNRPDDEVKMLMSLIIQAVARETPDLIKNGIKVVPIGDTARLPKETMDALNECIEATKDCTRMTVVLALSYSSKWEITEVAKQIAEEVKEGKLNIDNISEDIVNEKLTTRGIPDPEVLIRTGGEQRISNFLLWQIAYSELYFTDVLWPDFDREALYEAILDYQGRERRFGKTSAQLLEEE